MPDLRWRLAAQREDGHKEVDDPADADIVLFAEGHLIGSDWRLESFASTQLAKIFHDKIVVYDERDRPWCRFPGIYVSMPRSSFVPRWQVAGSYWNAEPVAATLGPAATGSSPDLLFSFVGSRTHACREPLFALRSPRAQVEAVEDFMFWDQASPRYEERRRAFAETIIRSKFVLCPRGHGTASIRLFEVMSAGRVPVIISDEWVPPEGPSWEEFSLRWPQSRVAELPRVLEAMEGAAEQMGAQARAAYLEWFAPDIVIKRQLDELETLLNAPGPDRFPRPGYRNWQYLRCLGAPIAGRLKHGVGHLFPKGTHQMAPAPSGVRTRTGQSKARPGASFVGSRSGRYKVVYFDHCAKISGAELALARTLPSMTGFDPLVVLAEEGPLVTKLRERGVPVQVLAMPPSSRLLRRESVSPSFAVVVAGCTTLRYVVDAAKFLRRERPDLVVTNSLKAAVYGGLAGNLARMPVVWHVHDRIETDYLPGPAVKLVRTLARLLPSAVIANSQTTLESLCLASGFKRATTLAVVPPPCDLVVAQRKAKRGGDGELVVGMVGRLQPWKGTDLFLRAFAAAFPDGGAKAVLVGGALFGEDDFVSSLHTLADSLALGARVRFTGHIDDPSSEMERFDVLVHCSVIPEPFGQVVVEGMALGLPVVASRAGGPAEIITDGVDGVLCPPGDEDALASALRTLAGDLELRRRLGEAAAQTARAYSPATIAARVAAVYHRALQNQL